MVKGRLKKPVFFREKRICGAYPQGCYFSSTVSRAIFIIVVKEDTLSSGLVSFFETKLSEIVSRQAAFLPVTLALENNAKLSISTALHPRT
jgi:hypothetical protein